MKYGFTLLECMVYLVVFSFLMALSFQGGARLHARYKESFTRSDAQMNVVCLKTVIRRLIECSSIVSESKRLFPSSFCSFQTYQGQKILKVEDRQLKIINQASFEKKGHTTVVSHNVISIQFFYHVQDKTVKSISYELVYEAGNGTYTSKDYIMLRTQKKYGYENITVSCP